MDNLLFHHHTREEISKKAKSGYAVVVPLAATEQHGPHLPVYTDTLICEQVAIKSAVLATKQVPLLVTPTIPIGSSDHHKAFGGTISFSSSTYLQVLRDIGDSLVTCGFSKILFLNGHGGNNSLMTQTAGDLAMRHPVWTASGAYWNIAAAALKEAGAAKTGPVPGHAGGFETALIAALYPSLVKMENLPKEPHQTASWMGSGPPGTFIGRHKWITGHDGYTDAPKQTNAELGKQCFETITTSVSEWMIHTVKTMDRDI